MLCYCETKGIKVNRDGYNIEATSSSSLAYRISKNYKTLESSEIISLFQQLEEVRKNNDSIKVREIEQKLIKGNLRLASLLTNKYERYFNKPFDEIFYYAYLGLTSAIKKFDYTLGNTFATYAYGEIKGALFNGIKKEFCFSSDAYVKFIKYKRDFGDNFSNDIEIVNDMLKKEIITRMQGEELLRLIFYNPIPYDELTYTYNIEGTIDDKGLEMALTSACDRVLNSREIDILTKRYGLFGNVRMNDREIAEQYGVSYQRIFQIMERALKKLRERASSLEAFVK